jgi:hypothetical protein
MRYKFHAIRCLAGFPSDYANTRRASYVYFSAHSQEHSMLHDTHPQGLGMVDYVVGQHTCNWVRALYLLFRSPPPR